jgi:hypothetical protein
VHANGPICSNTSTGYTAITDLGSGSFQGEQGGLYPGGSNTPPAAYQAAGVRAAQSVVQLDSSGTPNANGKIGFISIGMSNASGEFRYFSDQEAGDSTRNAGVVFVNGAQPGQVARAWSISSDQVWSVLEQRLVAAGVTDQQVEVIWLKEVDLVPTHPDFQTYARTLQQELTTITSIAAGKFPNLRQLFVSARSYGGYSGIYPQTSLNGPNPEPWAYETGFADKWFVAQWVASPNQRPWVGWGPYFWTDGTRGRADGLQWLCTDTIDGTHPSPTGLAKVYGYMHSLFLNSAVTPWFRASSFVPPSPTSNPTGTPVASPGASPPGRTPPALSPPPRITHPPGVGQESSAPGGATPQPIASLPAAISQTISNVASMSPARRWSLAAILVILIIGGCAALGLMIRSRRRPAVVPIRPSPPADGKHQSLAMFDTSAEPTEPLQGVGATPTGDRPSTESDPQRRS